MNQLLGRWAVALGILSCLLFSACPAAAHAFRMSYFRGQVEGNQVTLELDLDGLTAGALLTLDKNNDSTLDAEEAQSGRETLLTYLDEKLEFVSSDGKSSQWHSCQPTKGGVDVSVEGERLQFERSYDCYTSIQALRVRNSVFMEDVGGHIFVADIRLGDRNEHINFAPHQQAYEVGPIGMAPDDLAFVQRLGVVEDLGGRAPPSVGEVFRDYLWQGMLHIWGGIDHVLFVLSLLLAVRRWADVGILVTSFTVAHSVTLILGALEIVPLEQWIGAAFVESSIALSIVYVAIENLWWTCSKVAGPTNPDPRRRVALTFLFGLIHGFGFSSVLREFGLPGADLTSALLAFNLGVELGQLAIVLPVFPLLLALSRRASHTRVVVRIGSSVVAGVAFLWFAERALGLSFMPF